MMMLPDPLAAGQLEEESTVEAAVGAEVDVLDNCRLAQPGLTQPAGKTLVLAAGRLAIDEQPKPIFATEFAGIGSVLQFDKGISHGSEAERAQPLDGGVNQHRICRPPQKTQTPGSVPSCGTRSSSFCDKAKTFFGVALLITAMEEQSVGAPVRFVSKKSRRVSVHKIPR